jgi:sialic acid synthase SpsE
MSKIILDFGSANSCHNDKAYIKRMYDELKAVDTGKHEVVIKWQLFERAGDNLPLTHETFQYAYDYGTKLGYKVTSSVFDKESLDFLLGFDVPMIKIANNRSLDYLIGEIPRKIPIIISLGDQDEPNCWLTIDVWIKRLDEPLYCVSTYPAKYDDYIKKFSQNQLHRGISDHTTDFSLFRKFEPEIIEWHYKLSDSTGLDAGPFARTPAQLSEVL